MKLIELLTENFSMAPGTYTVKYEGATVQYWVNGEDQVVEIYSIRVPQTKRKQGIASKTLEAFLNEVDKYGYRVKLIASPLDRRTRTDKLVNLYQRFGFTPTGRINMAGDPFMVREGIAQ